MNHFHYRDRVFHCEDVPVADLAAEYGTPVFVYSQAALLGQLNAIKTAFAEADPVIAYSVKTNGNLSICRLMAEHGAGFDVTSGGELFRALNAGGPGCKIVFAGVGKTAAEMRSALDNNIFLFNVESEDELFALGDIAQGDRQASPGRPAGEPGLAAEDARQDRHQRQGRQVRPGHRNRPRRGQEGGRPSGAVARRPAHAPRFADHVRRPVPGRGREGRPTHRRLREQGHPVQYLNMGGGFGIHYYKDETVSAGMFADAILPSVRESGCQFVLEPGRFICGNSGILLSRVLYNKETGGKRYMIQDAAMNDLIRPTLYDAFHRIWPAHPPAPVPEWPADFESPMAGTIPQDVVGPVCESGDFLAKARHLPPLEAGDLLATFQRRGVRDGDGLELQQPDPGGGGSRYRPQSPPDPSPGDVRRPGRL